MAQQTLSIKEQLLHLKMMTERFGSLHEAQILQIRNYPLLIPGVKKAEVSINIDKKVVIYNCTSSTGKFRKTKKVNLMVKNIYEYIKTIAWNDSILEIKVDNKDVFDSRTK